MGVARPALGDLRSLCDLDDDLDSPSNDGDMFATPRPINANDGALDSNKSDGALGSNTSDDGSRRLGIIAVSLAAMFALLMLILTAMIWRKYLWHAVFCPPSADEEAVFDDQVSDTSMAHSEIKRHSKVYAASIMRSTDTPVSWKCRGEWNCRF